MLPLEDLKAKAKAATPGPWRAGGTGAVICDTELDSVHFPVIADLHHNDRDHVEQNQAYIAAASPDVVLKLIERIETLQDAVKVFVEAGVDDGCGGYIWADQRIADAMLVAREALKAGEK